MILIGIPVLVMILWFAIGDTIHNHRSAKRGNNLSA